MPNVTLYYKPTCPFCLKVLAYLNMNGIEISLKNVMGSSQIREELIKIGGKSQVPCLVVDGKPVYESDDIIQWFEDNWKES